MDSEPKLLASNARDRVLLKKYLKTARILLAALTLLIILNSVLFYGAVTSKPYTTTAIEPRLASVQSFDYDISLSAPSSRDLAVVEDVVLSSQTDLSNASIEERDYLWWLLGMSAVRTVDQVMNWYSIQSACGEFAATNWNAAQCVWAAVSTAILYGASIVATYQRIGRITTADVMIAIGAWKRSSPTDVDILAELTLAMGVELVHLGTYESTSTNTTISSRSTGRHTQVFGFTSHQGLGMHFGYMGNTTSYNTTANKTTTYHHIRFGFGNGTVSASPAIRGRQQYNEQYFTEGGIDFIIQDNVADGGVLSLTNDYGQMDHEVSCYMGNRMTAAGHYYQVYDNNHDGTIAAGAVAPFRAGDHWSLISAMYNTPLPIALAVSCQVS